MDAPASVRVIGVSLRGERRALAVVVPVGVLSDRIAHDRVGPNFGTNRLLGDHQRHAAPRLDRAELRPRGVDRDRSLLNRAAAYAVTRSSIETL